MLLGVCDLGLGGSTEPPKPPLDPPQSVQKIKTQDSTFLLGTQPQPEVFFHRNAEACLPLTAGYGSQPSSKESKELTRAKKMERLG